MAEPNRLFTLPAKWLNRLSPLLFLLAIIWLCWGLSRIMWLLISPPQAPTVQFLPRPAEIKPQSSNMNAFTIFKNPIVKIQDKVKVSTKPTNMILKGVMEASPMSSSSAMIEINGKMKNYRVDNEIEETGYTLSFVDWNKIIIEDSQQRETIIKLNEPMELDQEFVANSRSSRPSSKRKKHSSMPSQNNSRTNQSSRNSTTVNNTTSSKNKNTRPNTTNSKTKNTRPNTSSTNTVDNIVSEITKNPSGYLSKMGVMATGKGYSVTDAMPANIRNKIGLQPGDTVLSVNGENVGKNPAHDAKILKKVQKSGQAQIQVQRGNQVITIRQQLN